MCYPAQTLMVVTIKYRIAVCFARNKRCCSAATSATSTVGSSPEVADDRFSYTFTRVRKTFGCMLILVVNSGIIFTKLDQKTGSNHYYSFIISNLFSEGGMP